MNAFPLAYGEAPGACPLTVAGVTQILGADVYLVDDEVATLAAFAGECDRAIVEIGCACGGSTSVLLSSCGLTAHLHSIDPFVVDSMGDWAANEGACRRNVMTFMARLGRFDCFSRWTLHVRPSYDAAPEWELPIEMLFIDGDHVYDAVRRDLEDWLPHVEPGGIILVHDSCRLPGTPEDEYARGWQGPTQLAVELLDDERVETLGAVHSLTIWRKR